MIVPLALYVHIPFCDYRCRYCNFTFETGWSDALMKRTLDGIVREAETLAQRGQRDDIEWRIRTLYLGGGTPGLVPIPLLSDLIRGLENALGFRTEHLAEATLEANPENVSIETLQAWEALGFRRLSVGVQTFSSERLALLGRWCDGPTNRRALGWISQHWRHSWSADLMTGLPGQGNLAPQRWIDVRDDLDEILSFGPSHLSLYSLTVEPETDLAQLKKGHAIRVSSEPVADQLWLRARQTLVDRGWDWYEISNFAWQGQRSVHNQTYWRLDPWAGLGPGAEGTIPFRDSEGRLRPLRTRNPRLFPWLAGGHDEVPLSAAEFWLEHYLVGWRTSDGLVPGRIEHRFKDFPSIRSKLRAEDRLMLNFHLEQVQEGPILDWNSLFLDFGVN